MNSWAPPQGCVCSVLCCSRCSQDCAARSESKIIVKFAVDTSVVGLISNNDKTSYREEVERLCWCHSNSLSLNVDKTKEMIVDFRRRSAIHTPLLIGRSEVERVSSTKLLGVHISDDLIWSINTNCTMMKEQQRLHFLQRLKSTGFPPPILISFTEELWRASCAQLYHDVVGELHYS